MKLLCSLCIVLFSLILAAPTTQATTNSGYPENNQTIGLPPSTSTYTSTSTASPLPTATMYYASPTPLPTALPRTGPSLAPVLLILALAYSCLSYLFLRNRLQKQARAITIR